MIPLETIAYRAPLGPAVHRLGRRGDGGRRAGRHGLARRRPGGARLAVQSPISTIMGFGLLPGLAGYEESRTGTPGAFSWPPAGPGQPFEVRVADPSGRYLPELSPSPSPSRTWSPLNLYLSAEPGQLRRGSPRCAVRCGRRPRGTCRVGDRHDRGLTDTYVTMADQLGRYVVYFPYPEALPASGRLPARRAARPADVAPDRLRVLPAVGPGAAGRRGTRRPARTAVAAQPACGGHLPATAPSLPPHSRSAPRCS